MPIVKPRVISRRVEVQKPEKIKRTLRIDDFYRKRNKILIIRAIGGLGDILMHRMMFEDFKLIMPDCELHFACPIQYHDALIDHPYIDQILDSGNVCKNDYIISYNTTTACGRYEMRMAPFSGDHRSDIWAEHCGINLTKHNMHISLHPTEIERGKSLIEEHRDRDGPSVLISPVSAMKGKDLLDHQLKDLIEGLHERGCYPFGLHKEIIPYFYKNNIPTISGIDIRTWMGIIRSADYVISVDTSTFHCAGGMGKPLVGVYTFADGKVYGKYYDFFLVQKHRDDDPCWNCGPCYNWGACPKSKRNPKPCLTELTGEMILKKVDMMFEKWPQTSLS